MGLIQKKGSLIVPCGGANSDVDTTDDTLMGGLIGELLGILGGPIGMLFTGSLGVLIGSSIDLDDTKKCFYARVCQREDAGGQHNAGSIGAGECGIRF